MSADRTAPANGSVLMMSYSVTSPGGMTSSIRIEPPLKMESSVPGAARSMLAANRSVRRVGMLRTLDSRPSSASLVVATTRFGSKPWERNPPNAASTHRLTAPRTSSSSGNSGVIRRR
jgi:hypothetical protein